jgi:hypothetical protein
MSQNGEQKIIYVVTAGEYSDYHIVGVFDDGALAHEFVERQNKAHGHDWGNVEEYLINELAPFMDNQEWKVWFDKDGNIERIEPTYISERPDDAGAIVSDIYYQLHRAVLVRSIIAPDEEHAIKIAGDIRAQFLAHKAGIT